LIISTPPQEQDPVAEQISDHGPQSELLSLKVPGDAHGLRLDKSLCALLPGFSRSYLQQRITAGDVRSGGMTLGKASSRVRIGQVLDIVLRETPQSQAFVPEQMDLSLVHEDAHLRVIYKPSGLVVHPAPGHWQGTLLNGLLALDEQAMLLPRAGIVHRLDKDTSGLMVVARTRQAMDALVSAISAREVRRQYLAVVAGRWRWEAPVDLTGSIGRDPQHRQRMAVVDMDRHPGKPACTTVKSLLQSEQACLLHCRLHTGRTHQIRVHLANAGFPLIGDSLYGGRPLGSMNRQALHAWQLAFVHPATGRPMEFLAEPPPDMMDLFAHAGLRYNFDSA
jgi:23S rRNA pseudouridine1911/1915/1917 synthase